MDSNDDHGCGCKGTQLEAMKMSHYIKALGLNMSSFRYQNRLSRSFYGCSLKVKTVL